MKHRDPSPDITPDAVEQAAADWLVLSDRGLTREEAVSFEAWLRADARHADVYAELESVWRAAPKARTGVESPRHRSSFRRHWLPAVLAAAASLAVVVWWRHEQATTERFAQNAVTENGTLKRMDLPDGSILHLNARSAIEVDFTAKERQVRLVRGEMHVEVAKNPARPFTVTAGRVTVQAVGTAFGVSLLPNAAVDVLVTEGKVRVEDALQKRSLLPEAPATTTEAAVLHAGQRVVVAAPEAGEAIDATLSAVDPAGIEAALAWHKRQLQFVATPLADIAAEFNRFNRHRLVVVDPRLAERSFGGTFLAGDYETFVRLLEVSAGVRAERREHETLLSLEKE